MPCTAPSLYGFATRVRDAVHFTEDANLGGTDLARMLPPSSTLLKDYVELVDEWLENPPARHDAARGLAEFAAVFAVDQLLGNVLREGGIVGDPLDSLHQALALGTVARYLDELSLEARAEALGGGGGSHEPTRTRRRQIDQGRGGMSDNRLRLLRAVDRLDATERLVDGMIDIAIAIATEVHHDGASAIPEIGAIVKGRMKKIRPAMDKVRYLLSAP